jgi:hypothetical protein
MNAQNQHFVNTQGFRISVIAFLAVVALAGAAFWFGTGLRADTAPSVAPSPLGSSLTAVRESRSEDYVGRLMNSSAAAGASRLGDRYDRMNSSSAAAGASQLGDRYDLMNAATAASRWASVAAHDVSWARFYIAVNATNAAMTDSSSADLNAAGQYQWIKPEGLTSSAAANSAAVRFQSIKPEGIRPSAP